MDEKQRKRLLKVLQAAIEKQGWTPTSLHKACGVSQPSISRIKNGEQFNLKNDTQQKLFEALHIDVYYVADMLDKKICDQLPYLTDGDKITTLRYILRLRSSEKETSRIMKKLLEEFGSDLP